MKALRLQKHSYHNTKVVIAWLLSILLLWPCVGAEAGEGLVEETSLENLLDEPPDARDLKNMQTLAHAWFDPETTGGALGDGGSMGLVPMTSRLAALRAIENNLTLARQRVVPTQAMAVVEQARAVFDPEFNLSIGQTVSRTYARQHTAKVKYKTFSMLPIEDGVNEVILVNPNKSGPQVDKIQPGKQQGRTVYESIAVSSIAPGDPSVTGNVRLNIAQNLPWGGSVQLTQTTTRLRSYDSDAGKYWQHPWGAGAGVTLTVPLPLTRGFGSHNSQQADLDKARISLEQSDYSLRKTLNDTLARVDLAYLDLCERLEGALVAVENHTLARQRLAMAERRYTAQAMTQLDFKQMQIESRQAGLVEEQGRLDLVAASYDLGLLISSSDTGDGEKILWFPQGCHRLHAGGKGQSLEEDIALAGEVQPTLSMARLDIASAQTQRDAMDNQARVDLSYSGSWQQSQANAVYGYGSLGDAVGNIADPDVRSFTHGVVVTRTLGNRGNQARARMGQLGLEVSQLAEEKTWDDVKRDVANAHTTLAGAMAQLEVTKKEEALAEQTFIRIERRWSRMGDVGSLELNQKNRVLNQARLARIKGEIELKKSRTRLYAALGVLPGLMAVSEASNGFDRTRLLRLAGADLIPSFSDLAVVVSRSERFFPHH